MEVRYPPHRRGISALLARYHMKTRQMGAIPPLRYYLEKVLRDMGGVSRTGPLSPSVTGWAQGLRFPGVVPANQTEESEVREFSGKESGTDSRTPTPFLLVDIIQNRQKGGVPELIPDSLPASSRTSFLRFLVCWNYS